MKSRFISIIIGTLIGVLLLTLYAFILRDSHNESGVTESGEALIGGVFEMRNLEDEIVTDASFEGKYTLYYFGYSFCPDVCPLDMLRASMALDILSDRGVDLSHIQGVFVTIDPARDTAPVLREFLGGFNPLFTAIYGDAEQTRGIANAFRVYYAKGDILEEDVYLMNHSNLFYLMDPQGRFVTHFASDLTPELFAVQLERHID